MTITKLVARIVQDQLRRTNQRRRRTKWRGPNRKQPRIGVKNIEGRIRNTDIKIKQLIPQPKNIQVKENGQIVRQMIVRQKTIYPAQWRNVQY